MSFEVRWSVQALEDVLRLHDFLLERAETLPDLELADVAIEVVETTANSLLARAPYSYRKAGASSTRRELVVSFGATGYVVLFEIDGPASVLVLAVRHQREQDYH